MTWVTVDDGFAEHPKVWALSNGAFRLHVSGIAYCCRYLTDGRIVANKVSTLVPNYRGAWLRELERAEMWVAEGDAFVLHDFLQWNLSRDEVQARREKRRSAGQMGAKKRWHG